VLMVSFFMDMFLAFLLITMPLMFAVIIMLLFPS
jgi:hypothetical protein